MEVVIINFVLFNFVYQAYGMCDMPCEIQNRLWFDTRDSVEGQFSTSSFDLVKDGSVYVSFQCYRRNGPHFMFNSDIGVELTAYACVKISYSKDVIMWFPISAVTVPVNSTEGVNFCSLCSGPQEQLHVLVPKDLTGLGCDVPKNCPSEYEDNQCTGCEPGVPDDGYNCNCDVTKKPYDDSYDYPSSKYPKSATHT